VCNKNRAIAAQSVTELATVWRRIGSLHVEPLGEQPAGVLVDLHQGHFGTTGQFPMRSQGLHGLDLPIDRVDAGELPYVIVQPQAGAEPIDGGSALRLNPYVIGWRRC
jgi:hypothetical protein